MMQSWVHIVVPITLYFCWYVWTNLTQQLMQFYYFSIIMSTKSSQLVHHCSCNSCQAIAQLPTGIWMKEIYSLKAPGAPVMTIIPFSGKSLNSITWWEGLEVLFKISPWCLVSQPKNPSHYIVRPSSLSSFQQNFYIISTGAF